MMLSCKYEKYFINFQKVYFSDQIVKSEADIIRYIQYKGKNLDSNNLFFTSLIDLDNSEEIIRSKIRKSYLHLINQAKKKYQVKIKYFDKPDKNELLNFSKIHNEISLEKGYALLDLNNLISLKNNILISYAYYDQKMISGQLYVYDNIRIRLLNSFIQKGSSSELRMIIGSANKFHYFSDIIFAKKNNFKLFDLGGIFNIDSKAKGITFFKLGFSRNIEKSNNLIIANTFKGKIVLFFYKFFNLNTIKRLLFYLKIKFYIKKNNVNLDFLELNFISEFSYFFNDIYKYYCNLREFLKLINLNQNERLILFGEDNPFILILLQNLQIPRFDIAIFNLSKIKIFKNLSRSLQITNIKLYRTSYDEAIKNLDYYKYFIINNKDITIKELKFLLKNICSTCKNKKVFIVYLNPIFNHIFGDYNLFLIDDVKSELSTRVHLYTNFAKN